MQYEMQECSLSIEPKSISTAQISYIVYNLRSLIVNNACDASN